MGKDCRRSRNQGDLGAIEEVLRRGETPATVNVRGYPDMGDVSPMAPPPVQVPAIARPY